MNRARITVQVLFFFEKKCDKIIQPNGNFGGCSFAVSNVEQQTNGRRNWKRIQGVVTGENE